MARAVITGASGLVGSNLAVELLRQGHTVRATRRPGSKVAQLDGHAIEWVSADLGDVASLRAAFAGADVVFHCAAQVGVSRHAPARMVRSNVDGTRHVIEAVRASGVRRLVHCSTVATVGLSEDGQPCTETARWNFPEHGLDDGYTTTKHQAELLLGEEVKQGLDAVVVNPTFMFGPMDVRPSSGKFILEVMRGWVPARSPGFSNFVDVRDVARGMVLAWEKGKSGERYILSDENLSWGQAMDRVAAVAGVRAPWLNVPYALAAPVGWLGDVVESLGGTPLINSVTLRFGYCTRMIYSNEKAKRELGYSTSPLDTAIADAIAWFRAAGMVK